MGRNGPNEPNAGNTIPRPQLAELRALRDELRPLRACAQGACGEAAALQSSLSLQELCFIVIMR